jgi:hypothetical protein
MKHEQYYIKSCSANITLVTLTILLCGNYVIFPVYLFYFLGTGITLLCIALSNRMAHPGGPLTTNKAAALAKFLERKLQQPDGLDSLNPDLVKLAVKNAKETIKASNGTLLLPFLYM